MIGPPTDPPNCCRLNGDFSPFACFREEVLRGQLPVALVAEHRSVQQVGPGLGDQRDRGAAGAAVCRRELTRRELELLQAFRREASATARCSGCRGCRRRPHSSPRCRRLIPRTTRSRRSPWSGEAAPTGAAPGSSSSMPLIVRVIIGRFCTSVVSIVLATFDWVVSMSGDWPVTVSVSSRPARLSSEVDGDRRVHVEPDIGPDRCREAGQVGLDFIRARLEPRYGIQTFLVGDRGARDASAEVGRGDRDSREYRVSLIENPAVEGARGLLGEHRSRGQQAHGEQPQPSRRRRPWDRAHGPPLSSRKNRPTAQRAGFSQPARDEARQVGRL